MSENTDIRFRVQGADRREYGPAPLQIVARWIAERRLDGGTLIQRVDAAGAGAWRPAREHPELARLLATGPMSPPPPLGGVPVPGASGGSDRPVARASLGGGVRTSGMAIAALVLGLLSPCTVGLLAVPGLIVGALALRRIRRSEGREKGRGMALAGVVLSGIFLVVGPSVVIAAIVARHRAEAQYRQFNTVNECVVNLQALALAVRQHANANNDQFPSGTNWCDAIQGQVQGLNVYQCTARPGLRSGFALNSAVAGKSRFDVPGDTVLLFESDLGWNASGDLSAVIAASRHANVVNAVLADGTVRQVPVDAVAGLRWIP